MFLSKKYFMLFVKIFSKIELYWCEHYYELRMANIISNLEMKKRILKNPLCPLSVIMAVENQLAEDQSLPA